MIDLRSDTVTRPTAAMRKAMAEAEVGDDVYREDPTVRRLEDEAALLLGKEAALFVPTGSMGNEVAVMVPAPPRAAGLLVSRCRILSYKIPAAATLSGGRPRPGPGARGRPP